MIFVAVFLWGAVAGAFIVAYVTAEAGQEVPGWLAHAWSIALTFAVSLTAYAGLTYEAPR